MGALFFLSVDEVVFIHQDQIKRHGGAPGILNQGSLECAVVAAEFAAYYHPSADIHWLSAHYAVHLAQNHAFQDGNKRTGIASALVFLALNGRPKHPTAEDHYRLEEAMVAIAQRLQGKENLAGLLQAL